MCHSPYILPPLRQWWLMPMSCDPVHVLHVMPRHHSSASVCHVIFNGVLRSACPIHVRKYCEHEVVASCGGCNNPKHHQCCTSPVIKAYDVQVLVPRQYSNCNLVTESSEFVLSSSNTWTEEFDRETRDSPLPTRCQCFQGLAVFFAAVWLALACQYVQADAKSPCVSVAAFRLLSHLLFLVVTLDVTLPQTEEVQMADL